MPADRLLHVLERLGTHGESSRLCEVSKEIVAVTGAGIMLMCDDVHRGSVCSSDEVSHLIETLQFSLGEGPCVDAHFSGRPVLEPNLAAPTVPRWLAFSGPALAAGVRAVFGFPMRVGAIRLGSLNLYRDERGPLDVEQHANAMVMADVAGRMILSMQAAAAPGLIAAELEAGADFHFVVHQAAGMVSEQLHVTLAVALIRVRAYAFANELGLSEVAHDVVARRLRFA
jgi:hypothetical protein